MLEELRLAAFVPTVEEWLAAVHSRKRNISPGMNGVTYDLLRELPEIVLRGLHQLLSEAQARKMAPEQWKKHCLNVIPKLVEENGIVSSAKLRPLFLIDSARKLWMGILDRKASKIHDKHKFFSTA